MVCVGDHTTHEVAVCFDLHAHYQRPKREILAHTPDRPAAACVPRVGWVKGGDLSNFA